MLHHRIITQREIIETTACPECGAPKGLLCLTYKKKLNERKHVHLDRYEAAKKILLV